MNAGRSDELSSLRILVVEDDTDILRMVTKVLETAGASVTGAASGHDAMVKIDNESFDALIVDWNLGDMPNGSMLPQLSATHPELLARTLVMTGELVRAPGEHAATDAGYAMLTKPFRPAALRKAIIDLVA